MSDTAQINNAGTAELTSGAAAVSTFSLGTSPGDVGSLFLSGGHLTASTTDVGGHGTGFVIHTAGTLTGGTLNVGTSAGTYLLEGTGRLTVSLQYIGYGGTGAFVQNGGINTASSLRLASGQNTLSRSSGTYDLTGGQLVTTTTTVGEDGPAVFTQSGGSHRVNGTLYVGTQMFSNAAGTYSLLGSASLSAYSQHIIGTFVHTSGTNSVSNSLNVWKGSYSMGDAAHLTAGNIEVASGATFLQNGGIATVSNAIAIGPSSSSGAYQLAHGGQLISRGISVASGSGSIGSFTQTGGSVNTSGQPLYLAQGNSGALATYSLHAGSLSTGHQYIGQAGTASFEHTGGVNRATGNLYLGDASGAIGTYSLSGNAQLFSGTQYHANAASSRSTFTHAGGTNSTGASTLYLAHGANSSASYSLSAGYLFSGHQYVGYGGAAAFTQSGGVNDLAASTLYVAHGVTSVSSYSLSEGLLLSGSQYVGYRGTGTFLHTGGTNNLNAATLTVGYAAKGFYLLSGAATLLAGIEEVGPGPGSLFRQTGGTNSATRLNITGQSRYELSGGSLHLAQSILTSGTLDLASTASADTGVNILSGGSVNLLPGGMLSTPLISNDGSLNLSGGAVRYSGSSATLNYLTGIGSTAVAAGVSLDVSYLRQSSLSIAGAVTVSHAKTPSSLKSLTVAPSGVLNLNLNPLVLDYTGSSPAGQLRLLLLDNRVYSSAVAGDPTRSHALGYVDASALSVTNFFGLSVDATALLIRYTRLGDANLDGKVDANDYALIDRGHASGASVWWFGDFNYDGSFTAADYALIDRAFAQQNGTLSAAFLATRESQFGPEYVAQLLTSIPEPGSVAMPLVLIAFTRRRRRLLR
jgi:hypothetical protein